jgi:hypothetical protein
MASRPAFSTKSTINFQIGDKLLTLESTPLGAPKSDPKPKPFKPFVFANKGKSVTRGYEFIAEAVSPSMARRIRNALNVYKPGPDGR